MGVADYISQHLPDLFMTMTQTLTLLTYLVFEKSCSLLAAVLPMG